MFTRFRFSNFARKRKLNFDQLNPTLAKAKTPLVRRRGLSCVLGLCLVLGPETNLALRLDLARVVVAERLRILVADWREPPTHWGLPHGYRTGRGDNASQRRLAS